MTILATPPAEAATPPATGFQRRLGPFDATMLVAGSMIGSGIFIVSAEIARDVGSAGGLLAVWAVTGLMTVCGALCYAELAAMMPRAGGQYIFLREAYTPLGGFLYGWTLFLVIQTGTIAAVGVAFGKFLGVLVPVLGTGEDAILFRTPFHLHLELPLFWLKKPLVIFDRTEFTVAGGQLVGAALVAFLTWLNCRGVQEGKVVQNIFTVAKTLALIAVILVGLTLAANASVVQANLAAFWNTPATQKQGDVEKFGFGSALAWLMVAGGAMVGALFSSDAWNNVTFAAGEVKNPRRTLPLSLVCGTALVTTLYLLANVAYLAALPVNGNSDKDHYLRTLTQARLALVREKEAEARLLEARLESLRAGTITTNLAEGDEIAETAQQAEIKELEQQAEEAATRAATERARKARRTEVDFAKATRDLGISHARDDRVGTAAMQLAFPAYGAPLMAIAIMISTFGCLNGLILAGARLYWAMARDGLFFRSTGALNARGVPAAGLVLQGFWAAMLIFSGTYNELLNFVIFAALLFYVLTVTGLFVLRFRRPAAERPYRVFAYPLLPLVYIIVAALIMVDLLIVRPGFTWPGLAIVLTGLPAYFIWRIVGRPAPVSSVES